MKKPLITVLISLIILIFVSCGIPFLYYYDSAKLRASNPDPDDLSVHKFEFANDNINGVPLFGPNGSTEKNTPAVVLLYTVVPTPKADSVKSALISKFKSNYADISSSSTVNFTSNEFICEITNDSLKYYLYPFTYSDTTFGDKNFPYSISAKSYGVDNKYDSTRDKVIYDFALKFNNQNFTLDYLTSDTTKNSITLNTYKNNLFNLSNTDQDFENVQGEAGFTIVVFYSYFIVGNNFNNLHWAELKTLTSFDI